ncbi:MAG: TIGR00730 family Rossman fold protein [Acidobacteria bacterium]|nr:TIGR00730 family Rossman fold protein [Acidobacteriota bacterium]
MKSVAVFCGSRPGNDERFIEAARRMGREIAEQGLTLVYGGGRLGLMGEAANAALDAGGRVIGVIPQALVEREHAHGGLDELHIVESMHQRKAKMAELAEGFVSLPGGLGTLEETFEVWTWAQLGLHRNPVGLYNVGGFWDPLIRMLEHMVAAEFVQITHARMVHVADEPRQLLLSMAAHVPPPVRTWIEPDET